MKKAMLTVLFLMCIFVSPLVCFAQPIITNQGTPIDLNKKADLIINFKTIDNEPLSGAKYHVYKVANISDYATFSSVGPFDKYDLDFEYLDDDGWNALALQLANYVNEDKIDESISGKTNQIGQLKFENIDLGLYLVVGDIHVVGANTYTPQVFLISLPNMLETDKWEYSVEVYPKYSYDLDVSKIVSKKVRIVWDDEGFENRRPKSVVIELYKDGVKHSEVSLNTENNWNYTWESLDNSYEWTVKEIIDSQYYISNSTYLDGTFTITISYKSSLPNTGMLWWPVPILFVSGLIIFFIGILVRDKDEEEE